MAIHTGTYKVKKLTLCKHCGSSQHYSAFCRNRLPIPIKRVAIKKTTKKITKVVKSKKPKAKTRGYYVRQLDKVFSTFIRLRDQDNGCITCNSQAPWKEQQDGHFFTRGRFATRWHEHNNHMQCVRCNVFLKGNYIIYTIKMIDKYGREFVNELETLSKSTKKITTQEIKDMIEYYSKTVKDMQ